MEKQIVAFATYDQRTGQGWCVGSTATNIDDVTEATGGEFFDVDETFHNANPHFCEGDDAYEGEEYELARFANLKEFFELHNVTHIIDDESGFDDLTPVGTYLDTIQDYLNDEE